MQKEVQADDGHGHHEELVAGVKEEMRHILENSSQPVLVYLDDNHKTGNLAMATLLGYTTVEEFENSNVNFVDTYIAEESQQAVMDNYRIAFRQELKATVLDVTIKNVMGEKKAVQFIHVPMMFQDHLFAVSFVNG